VMIGDTPYDVEAALRAGFQIIALTCGGWTRQDLSGAIEMYDDPADLLRNYDRSILSRLMRGEDTRVTSSPD
jgi:phosphoglycolate phosphatase-like HAD superfamily hydrolase